MEIIFEKRSQSQLAKPQVIDDPIDMENDFVLAVSYELQKNPFILKRRKNFKNNMKLGMKYQRELMQDELLTSNMNTDGDRSRESSSRDLQKSMDYYGIVAVNHN